MVFSRGNLFSKKGSLSSSPSKNVFGGRGKRKTHRRLNGRESSAIGFSKAGESFLKRGLVRPFRRVMFPAGPQALPNRSGFVRRLLPSRSVRFIKRAFGKKKIPVALTGMEAERQPVAGAYVF